ncbi:MAG TPA: ornithine carbamoyltransferase [Phycisphaerae bacterium]|nr:ornithine carbamoyltransferase [Phycisphaerae bacterium]
MIKDFIHLRDFSGEQIRWLLDRAIADKKRFREGRLPATLPRKTLAMIFEKPSLRTRVGFEAAMAHLGGHAICLTDADIGLGKREPVQDVARVLGRICDGIMARTFSHELVEQLARHSPVPVVNGLTDYCHPCQAMADLMTIQERFSQSRTGQDPLAGRTIAFIGDGNNTARSLATACAKLGMRFVLAAPEGYDLAESFAAEMRRIGGDGSYEIVREPATAVAHADVLYTDTWISMGQESERDRRVKDFEGFRIDSKLLAAAPSHAIVLHCLPAYRGYEITDEALEAHAASIFDEAENRLHFQRTLLNVLIAEGGIP